MRKIILMIVFFAVHQACAQQIICGSMNVGGTQVVFAPPASGLWTNNNFVAAGYLKGYADSLYGVVSAAVAAINATISSQSAAIQTMTTTVAAHTASLTAVVAAQAADAANITTNTAAISTINSSIGSMTRTMFTQTANTTLNASTVGTTPTTVISAGVGTLSIPSSVTAGKQYRITVQGYISTPALLTNVATVPIVVLLGGVTVASSTVTGLTAGLTTTYFEGTTRLTFRSVGSSGTVKTDGYVDYMLASIGTPFRVPLSNTTSTSVINTTTANSLDIKLSFSNSITGNTIYITSVSLESLN